MKKYFTLLLILVANLNLFSQEPLQCGEDIHPGLIDESIYTHTAQRSSTDTQKYVFNIFFHVIRDSNGNNVTNTTENDIQDAVAMLNVTYNQFDIYFKYRGFDYIDDSSLLTIDYVSNDPNNEYQQLYNRPEFRNDAFNLFIVDVVHFNGGNAAGIGARPGILSVFNKDYLLSATLPHEIGHNFNLLHTYQGWNSLDCEHVNGDNCDTAGDLVCDTPASYPFPPEDIVNFEYCNGNADYQNLEGATDCIGYLYVDVPIHNFMSSNRFLAQNYYNNMRREFTPGQGVRMRETIANYMNSIYQPTQTTIASLYEPYEENTPVEIGEIHFTLQDNLAVGVPYYWAPLKHFGYKFQKGFDYEVYLWEYDWNYFYNSNTQQYEMETINYSYPFLLSSVDKPNIFCNNCPNGTPCSSPDQLYYDTGNIAIKILQIDTNNIVPIESSVTPIPGPTVQATTIISSDPNMNNATIKELNEQESNDPNLIDNLESGKVHRIIKHLDNGENDVKNVYKDN